MEELKLKAADQIKDAKQTSGENEKAEGMEKNSKGKTSNSSSAEQDLDKFLLGDLEDSDGGAGILPCSHVVMFNSALQFQISLHLFRHGLVH
jgi:hypothetical protein